MTAEIQAASIGIPDTFFILILALVVFGPRRLPEIGRQIGKLMYEFRKATNEFKYQMEEELRKSEEAEKRQKLLEENKKLYPSLSAPAAAQGESGTETEKPAEAAASTLASQTPGGLTIQPPSTGEAVFRGKTMSELNAEAEALAEQTRAAIAARKVETPAESNGAKPAAVKPKREKKTAAVTKGEDEPKPATDGQARKSATRSTPRKKAVTNG